MRRGETGRGGLEKTLKHMGSEQWRIPPIALELRVYRLLFIKNVVHEPSNHQQVITAIYGELRFEKERRQNNSNKPTAQPPLNSNKSCNKHPAADPWVQQLDHDLHDLAAHHEDFEIAWREAEFSHQALFRPGAARDALLLSDPRVFRNAFCKNTGWTPTRDMATFVARPGSVEIEEGQVVYICELDGCGQAFKSKECLENHQRFSKETGHGIQQLLYILTAGNRCLN